MQLNVSMVVQLDIFGEPAFACIKCTPKNQPCYKPITVV